MSGTAYVRHIAILICLTIIAAGINASSVQDINAQEQFSRAIESGKPVVAEFYDPACPICQRFEKSGTFARLAREYPDIIFVKLNSKKLGQVHKQHEIKGFPTFVFFNEGKEVHRASGFKDYAQLKSLVGELSDVPQA